MRSIPLILVAGLPTSRGQIWRDRDSKLVSCPGETQDLRISFQRLLESAGLKVKRRLKQETF